MRLREIPRREWPEFCEVFSLQHRGLPTSLLRVDPWGESEILVRDRALESIFPGAEAPGRELAQVLCVTLDGREEPTMLAVDAPSRIWVAQTEDGAHEAVRIDSADGASTVVVFRATDPRDGLDGDSREGP